MANTITLRELGCVLAALRYWQWRRHLPVYNHDGSAKERLNDILDIESNGDTLVPLNDDEIDDLCERLNLNGADNTNGDGPW